jgi:hypothetical protein
LKGVFGPINIRVHGSQPRFSEEDHISVTHVHDVEFSKHKSSINLDCEMAVMCDGVFRDLPLVVQIRKGVVKRWVLMPCFRTNIQWMNVAAAPQSTTAVVCNDLSGCMEEKMVAGTFNSLGFLTFWTIHTSREEVANIAVGLCFKNLFFWH